MGINKEKVVSFKVEMVILFIYLLYKGHSVLLLLFLGIVYLKNAFRKPKDTGIGRVIPLHDIEELPEEFVILDFETTGLDRASDKIVEVAALSYRNGVLVDTYTTLINPNMKIPPKVTKIHGINDSMVRGQPKIHQVIDKIYNRVNGKIVVGYNVNFDIEFLAAALKKSGKWLESVETIDVLEIARGTLSYYTDNMKLATIKKYFGIKNVSHRSMADCEVTFEVFKRCLEIRREALREMRERIEERNRKNREIQKERMAKLNDMEKHFISTLQQRFDEVGLKDELSFNILSTRIINFTVNNKQIGRVKLNGGIYKMQILDKDNVLWLEIQSVDEAINNIKHWVHYTKQIQGH